MKTRSLLPLTLSVALVGCNLFGGTPDEDQDTSSSSSVSVSSRSSQMQTANVSYVGTVEELGITVYQEGTHRLVLNEDSFILLEASDPGLDLDSYIGEEVELRGSVRPTVEAGGTIMTVEEVTVLSSDSSESSDSSDESSESTSSESSDESSVRSEEESSSSVESVSSASEESSASSEESTQSSISVDTGDLGPISTDEEEIASLATQNYTDAEEWTQKYCTGHMAFCVPVHRNWYYKSFGTTTNHLWHAEFGLESIEDLGQGPIVLNIKAGSSADVGATNMGILTSGNYVIGYKDLEDGRHIEVIADSRIQAAVEYMINGIEPYQATEE